MRREEDIMMGFKLIRRGMIDTIEEVLLWILSVFTTSCIVEEKDFTLICY
jgi:hypothetical protein